MFSVAAVTPDAIRNSFDLQRYRDAIIALFRYRMERAP